MDCLNWSVMFSNMLNVAGERLKEYYNIYLHNCPQFVDICMIVIHIEVRYKKDLSLSWKPNYFIMRNFDKCFVLYS